MKRRALLLVATTPLLGGRAAAQSEFKEHMATPELLRQLRGGGFVLYIRHGETDNRRADQLPPDLNDCGTQRVLNDAGRATMRLLGQRFRQLGIPVDTVLHSPMCRTRESAELAFPERPRRSVHELMYSANFTTEQKQPLLAALRQLVSTPPPPGSNTVIVAHAPNLADLFGYFVAPEGTVVILMPRGGGQFDYLGSIPPALWPALPARP
jgi:phosphohistidine phosphatase SixA